MTPFFLQVRSIVSKLTLYRAPVISGSSTYTG